MSWGTWPPWSDRFTASTPQLGDRAGVSQVGRHLNAEPPHRFPTSPAWISQRRANAARRRVGPPKANGNAGGWGPTASLRGTIGTHRHQLSCSLAPAGRAPWLGPGSATQSPPGNCRGPKPQPNADLRDAALAPNREQFAAGRVGVAQRASLLPQTPSAPLPRQPSAPSRAGLFLAVALRSATTAASRSGASGTIICFRTEPS